MMMNLGKPYRDKSGLGFARERSKIMLAKIKFVIGSQSIAPTVISSAEENLFPLIITGRGRAY